ncbi:hypothetical protein DEIGR_100842 [Deinococcus grandis]|uniref:Uncharacterized protein n=2 Tax=Deinococcus TaxID=1298 RepID=A0A100HHF6_9DEIO|nr:MULTISPECIES: hypothetical protein [Deinococcus]ALW87861.1 hypothetical protein AUC44_02250 [Deinococcus actinosclerus]BBN95699.1 hypothetical protein DEGR_24320 [Deinococcus grandis]GAQ20815.1 hypothetical protein DEIGR_100842 [Deinococcus grandis]
MPTAATDPGFVALDTVAVRKQLDYLLIAVKTPGVTTPVFERVSLVAELGAFAKNVQTSELPLFVEADGSTPTLRATQDNGGTIPFATASGASNPLTKKLIAAAKNGWPVAFKSMYHSAGVRVYGNGTIGDRGIQGDATAIPTWGFDLNVINYRYVDTSNNYIDDNA